MKPLPPLAAPAKKPRTWLITLLLAASAVAYVVFVFLPVQRSIRQLSSELQEKQQHVVQAQSLARPIAQAHEKLVATREVCHRWQDETPNKDELANRFARLSEQARLAGVTLERFEPQTTTALQVVSQHDVQLQFRGRFPPTFDFLGRLENLPGTIWFREVKLIVADEAGQTLQGELTLTIFVDHADYSD